MSIGIVYYTENRLKEPIFSIVQKQILNAGLPIVSVSLKPINFGKNIVLNLTPGYLTMIKQITRGLEESEADIVYFCEHDVLYHPSHFEITPPKDDIYYYNVNVWRWRWETEVAMTYKTQRSLSMVCYNRQQAIKHYKYRLELIKERKLDKDKSRKPNWLRKMGYEPGTKPRRRGGVTDEEFSEWMSEYPNIDIRHRGTFSHPKMFFHDFRHTPAAWQETNVFTIPGWRGNLKKLFNFG